MKHKHLLILFSLASCLAFADQIQLKSGDKITGKITKLDSGKVTIQTDFADEISVKWDKIAKLTSDSPIYLPGPNQKTLTVNSIERTDDEVVVSGANTPETRIAAADVTFFRSADDQKAYEKSLRPGLMEEWSGGLTFGLALARGNSDTTNIASGLALARTTLNDQITLYLTSVYATDAILNTTTSDAINAGARYDHNLTKRLFAYGSADFSYDQLQGLNLGSIIGGGLGVHVINRPNTTLDFLGGLSWTRQAYIGNVVKSFPSAQIGETFTKHLFANTDFKQRGFFYPDLTNSSQYNAALDAGLSTKVYKRLSWQVTFSDRYSSFPLPGKKGNDLLLSTGVGITVGNAAK
jgi:putative salt-induced outer membrane protein YdiY